MPVRPLHKKLTRILALPLAGVLLLSCASPAAAMKNGAPGPTLTTLMQTFITQNHLNTDNFSCAYYNTGTGETYYYNETKLFQAASLYKLPLNMYYYEQEEAGNINPDTTYFAGYKLSVCHQMSLQYSNNEVSEAMEAALGSCASYKHLMAKYGGMSDEELGPQFFSTWNYSAKFMLGTLQYLYDHADSFADAIGYLKAATPGQYFERYVPDSECVIAQKYGWLNDGAICNAAGIIYTKEPYLLVVFTNGTSPGGEVLTGMVNKLCYDYTVARENCTIRDVSAAEAPRMWSRLMKWEVMSYAA